MVLARCDVPKFMGRRCGWARWRAVHCEGLRKPFREVQSLEHLDASMARENHATSAKPLVGPRLSRVADLLDRLDQRIIRLLEGESHIGVARRLQMNAETVRRQRTNGRPSIQFILALIDAYEVSPLWLLCGRGPQRLASTDSWIMSEASTRELLAELFRRFAAAERPGLGSVYDASRGSRVEESEFGVELTQRQCPDPEIQQKNGIRLERRPDEAHSVDPVSNRASQRTHGL